MTYYQLQTGVIENEFIQLEYLTGSSLRIIRCIHRQSGKNLFAETPEFGFPTSYGKYSLQGGHRLWVSPETWDLTYAEENPQIEIEQKDFSLTLKQKGLAPALISKEIHLHLDPASAKVQINQIIRNDSSNTLNFAAWGLSMMAPGGTVLVQVRTPEAAKTGLLPDRSLVMWPYASYKDRRLDLRDDCILVHSNTTDDPFKLGLRNPHGRLAYLNNGIVFEKKMNFDPGAVYPDFGCNLEVYTNQDFVELEVLSGIQTVSPGSEVNLKEEWSVYPFSGQPEDWFTRSN